jgi:site-specific recombinase XerD
MLQDMFPIAHAKYAALPLLGHYVEDFVRWMTACGYPDFGMRRRVHRMVLLDRRLRRRGVLRLERIRSGELLACVTRPRLRDIYLSALTHSFIAFLDSRELLDRSAVTERERLITAYRAHLSRVRGFAHSTVRSHCATADELLRFIRFDQDRGALRTMSRKSLEAFTQELGSRLARGSLQHAVAQVRSFCRFLSMRAMLAPGFDATIDTARVYRGEKLPCAVSWSTVGEFLAAVDRSTPMGRRDFAMFLLIATYGLRVSEVAGLRLDDIDWQRERLSVPRRKVNSPLTLPLAAEPAAALLEYIQRDRPNVASRAVFLRMYAPIGPLVPTAVGEAFRAWRNRSGVATGAKGPHVLRHSLAVHLLRRGVPLTTIGDVLGHRGAESTNVYLRLHVEDLRDASLPLPRGARS